MSTESERHSGLHPSFLAVLVTAGYFGKFRFLSPDPSFILPVICAHILIAMFIAAQGVVLLPLFNQSKSLNKDSELK